MQNCWVGWRVRRMRVRRKPPIIAKPPMFKGPLQTASTAWVSTPRVMEPRNLPWPAATADSRQLWKSAPPYTPWSPPQSEGLRCLGLWQCPPHRCPVPTGPPGRPQPVTPAVKVAPRSTGVKAPHNRSQFATCKAPRGFSLSLFFNICIQHQFLSPSSLKNSRPCSKFTCFSLGRAKSHLWGFSLSLTWVTEPGFWKKSAIRAEERHHRFIAATWNELHPTTLYLITYRIPQDLGVTRWNDWHHLPNSCSDWKPRSPLQSSLLLHLHV